MMPHNQTSPTQIRSRAPGIAILVLATAQFINALDFNIVYVALPQIGEKLGFAPQSLQWVFSAYSVIFGGFLLLGGRAADIFGRRRMFLLGLTVFAVSSLFGGLAQTPAAIILARAAQGLGGAVVFPATISLITALFDAGSERNRALGAWALAGSLGLTLGALVGGILVGTMGWPSVFFVNVPIAAIVCWGALVSIPADKRTPGRKTFDLPGAISSTAGITLLVFTLVQAPEWGWTSFRIVGAAAASVIFLSLFILIEARTSSPLMPLHLARQRSLAIAMLLTFMFCGTFMAMPYFATALFQSVFGFSPLVTGCAFLLPSVAIAAGTQIGGRLATTNGVRPVLLSGLAIGAIGALLLAMNISSDSGYGALVAGFLIFGLGQGMAWTPMWITATEGIHEHEQGIASGMASTTLWVGGATGLAIIVLVSGPPEAMTQTTAPLVDSIRRALYAIAAGVTLTIPIASFTGQSAARGPDPMLG